MTPAQRKDFLRLRMGSIGITLNQLDKVIDELKAMEEYTDLLCIGSATEGRDYIILNGMPDDAQSALIAALETWKKREQDKRYYLKKEYDTL